MINWHDVEVEERIAQERYQVIVAGRQVQKYAPAASGIMEGLMNWTGAKMVRLGQHLPHGKARQTQSVTHPC